MLIIGSGVQEIVEIAIELEAPVHPLLKIQIHHVNHPAIRAAHRVGAGGEQKVTVMGPLQPAGEPSLPVGNAGIVRLRNEVGLTRRGVPKLPPRTTRAPCVRIGSIAGRPLPD